MQNHYPELIADHIGISVPDLDASIAWYGRMFGFELEMRQHLPIIPADIAFLRRGDFRIELFQVEGAAALPSDRREPNLDLRTHGNKHVCYRLADVPATVAGLRGRGADIVFEKVINGTPMAFIRDNAGNLIELIQRASANDKETT
jgi:methylmalonyl-CoA/ethylmalonyl-CoA epimerase